jgi:hypothetical protein
MAGSSINTDASRGELKLGVERRVFSGRTPLNVLGSLDRVRARSKTDNGNASRSRVHGFGS